MPKQKGGNEMSSAIHKKMGKIVYFFVFLGFVLFLVTCSGAQSEKPPATSSKTVQSQTSGSGINMCNILTKEEVSEILGKKIVVAKLEHQTGGFQCGYYGPDNDGRAFVDYDISEASQYRWELAKPKEVIPGLGEVSWNGFWLFAWINGGLLSIHVVGVGEKGKDLAISIAKKVKGRIK
ncbi:MAG: hypothetical protein ABIL52_00480 [candidate division WOR-3 bacterium]